MFDDNIDLTDVAFIQLLTRNECVRIFSYFRLHLMKRKTERDAMNPGILILSSYGSLSLYSIVYRLQKRREKMERKQREKTFIQITSTADERKDWVILSPIYRTLEIDMVG